MVSASALISFRFLPLVSIGAHTSTRIVPGRFAELVGGPELPGVVRNDEHGTSARLRQRRAADLKRARLAGRNACSLWKQRDPDSLIEARLAFVDQRSQRTARIVAIDCDRTQQTKCPAEERDVEQLALYQRCLRREQRLDEQRFPRAFMFHEDDARFAWNVLATGHPNPNAATDAQPEQHHSRPTADYEVETKAERKDPRDQHRQRSPENRCHRVAEIERDRSNICEDTGRHRSSSQSVAAARSSKIRLTPIARADDSEFAPLPVRTSTGRQCAAIAACMSRRESPTNVVCSGA